MRTSRTRLATIVAAVILLGTSPSISASGRTQAPPTTLPTLRLGILVSFAPPPLKLGGHLDPALLGSYGDAYILGMTNANLVHLLPNGRVAPDLATWTVSTNRRVYTFTLRRQARFNNGHPVTAQDAVFSLKRALAPSTNSPTGLAYLGLIEGAAAYHAGRAKTLAGVKVLNARVLRITITQPVAYFLQTLANLPGDVLDPRVVAGKPIGSPNDFVKTNYLSTTCTGNQGAGPFRFVCHGRSSTEHSFYAGRTPMYTLEPNPYYYGRKPHIEIQLPATATVLDGYKQYLRGNLDVVHFVPTVYRNRWKGRSKEYYQYPSSGVDNLMPNTHLPPFNDVHCRLAVAYAIDRETIANRIVGGIAVPTYAVVPKGMLGYYAGANNPHYSLARARAELAQCPSRTLPFEFVYVSTSENPNNEASAIAGMLSAAGMNVQPKGVSVADYGGILTHPLYTTTTQLILNTYVQDYPDPQDYCTLLLRSGAPNNLSGWQNTQYDRLVDRADVEPNRAKRGALYIQAQHLALSQGAFISLTRGINWALVKPYVHGLVGTEAYSPVVPKDYDWAKVSISQH